MMNFELALIEWLQTQTKSHPDIALGLGDDMAALAVEGSMILASSDMLLDGVHFQTEHQSLGEIGRKAIACSLSDCAAMAVRPKCATVSVAIPQSWNLEQAQNLYRGMFDMADNFDLLIVGGDTTRWQHPLVIDVAITATPFENVDPVMRSGAKPGDTLYVTGPLGGSLLGRHLTFEPRVREARLIAEALGMRLHAMMDISDGLSMDLRRMCQASHVGATLDELLLGAVISEASVRAAGSGDRSPMDHCLNDGEDFELLLAAEGVDDPAEIAMYPVGRVTDGEILIQRTDGTTEVLEPGGYLH